MPYIGKSPTGTGVRSRYYFTASGGETSLSGASDSGATLSFTDGAYVDVSLNGVALVAGTDYNTTTANTIGGLSALSASDIVEILVYDVFIVADTVSATSGGTFSGGVTMGGTLGVTGAATLSSTLGVTGKITSTAGITFGSDTAAANVLDDYEEGTWNPVFADAVSGGNASSTSATEATYIKIGSLVAITCKFENISISGLTTSNAAFIRGLPYVSQGRSVNSPWMQSVDVGTNPVHIVARIINNAQDIRFDQINDDGVDTTLTVAAFDSGVADVQLSMTYQTTF